MNMFTRMRIEWHVFVLDQRLQELPRSSRIARRNELRDNLRAASQDIGVKQALENLGNGRVLADEYLAAEFGTQPRPSWMAAAVFLCTTFFVLLPLLTEVMNAFAEGIAAGNPNATGVYTWSGVSFLQDTVTYTAANGNVSYVGGALTPLGYGIVFVGTIIVGRLWRVQLPRRRSKQTISE